MTDEKIITANGITATEVITDTTYSGKEANRAKAALPRMRNRLLL